MTAVPSILKFLNINNNFNVIDQNIDMPTKSKKRRLDHLSWEEKIQRKKLKNRVAAQTSRDRKKAKMEQMEAALQELFAKNEAILEECERLKEANQRLAEENAELHNRLRTPCVNCTAQNRLTGECEAESGSTVSLLRPRGTATHSAAALSRRETRAWLRMGLLCLLYRICSTNSTTMSTLLPLNNSRNLSSKTSPETWKLLLKKQMLKEQYMNQLVTTKWWGRHQKNWNPVEVR
ncbi:X-box-binding protein 1 isoform X2 [Aethina tumida]|uniref:X-box-binding protein 1 isoform X2 n=1 Tax=Aethina tumida TaxID=116153 RepID=UPI00096B20DB|nr:X-box-binding protein 1 isoform X2 [Aethina tumida]